MSILDRTHLPEVLDGVGAHSPSAAMEMEEAVDDVDWVNDVYTLINGTPRRNQYPTRQCLQKYCLAISSMLFAAELIAISLLVHGGLCVSEAFPSCSSVCPSRRTVTLVVTAVVLPLTALACAANCLTTSRTRLLRGFLALAVLYAVVCGAAATYTAVTNRRSEARLEARWLDVVETRPAEACATQRRLRCSGWRDGNCCRSAPLDEGMATSAAAGNDACFLQAANGTTYDPTTLQVVDWPRRTCASACTLDDGMERRTCAWPLQYRVRLGLVVAPLPLALAALEFLCVAVALIRSCGAPAMDNRMHHRF